jgi:hypothetical protein
LNFAAADAGRADAQALGGAFDYGSNRLQVQVPAALGHVVGVADAVPELWAATANVTYSRHDWGNLLQKL